MCQCGYLVAGCHAAARSCVLPCANWSLESHDMSVYGWASASGAVPRGIEVALNGLYGCACLWNALPGSE